MMENVKMNRYGPYIKFTTSDRIFSNCFLCEDASFGSLTNEEI